MVAAYALTLPTIGIQVPMPMVAGAAILGLSSLGALVLPSAYGAAHAAASVTVLAVFGVSEAQALAYAAAWWALTHGTAVVLGLPCIWQRGRVSEG